MIFSWHNTFSLTLFQWLVSLADAAFFRILAQLEPHTRIISISNWFVAGVITQLGGMILQVTGEETWQVDYKPQHHQHENFGSVYDMWSSWGSFANRKTGLIRLTIWNPHCWLNRHSIAISFVHKSLLNPHWHLHWSWLNPHFCGFELSVGDHLIFCLYGFLMLESIVGF